LRLVFCAVAAAAAVLLGTACNNSSSESQRPTATPSAAPAESWSETAAPGDTAGDSPLSTAELVEILRPSVVHILSEVATIDVFGQVVPQEGVGTGFIIDEEGHIVTNNHVISRGPDSVYSITVTLADGRQFPARIVGRDPPTDIAVLKIDAEGLVPVPLGNSSEVRVGEDVVAMGNALNLPGGPTVTKGVVSAVNRLIQEGNISIPDAIQTDAIINPGNSGGPLVNMRGEVIGITTAVIRGGSAEGIGLAIAIDSAKPIIEELMRYGVVNRGFLGVQIAPIPSLAAQQCGVDLERGVLLVDIVDNSPAAAAGLNVCDAIVRVEDVDIRSTGDLFNALQRYRAGETVDLNVVRRGQTLGLEVTLGEQPG
jgi:S1-C subfamily serine protease